MIHGMTEDARAPNGRAAAPDQGDHTRPRQLEIVGTSACATNVPQTSGTLPAAVNRYGHEAAPIPVL
jgi:hypothetical protein